MSSEASGVRRLN